ncbi:MAG TPA: sulfite reductase subunit alpha [Chthoniobacteraceae bacterium]|nr:sulfite reductase subunit alpha [Chthoniobacteraceae bacterium]
MSTTLSTWSRKNPFPAPLRVNRKLTGPGSEKDTRHFELSLAGSGLNYEVGDSLGVFASNEPELVDDIVRALKATGDEEVAGSDGQPKPLREALLNDYAIKQPSKQFLAALSERAGDNAPLLRELLQPERKGDLDEYLWGMEIIDFLSDHPSVEFPLDAFIKTLRKQIPRLYSIASSLKARPEQVDLTVATVVYESHGRTRKGVASTFLAERVAIGSPVPVFIHTAKGFRLPEDPSTPIIMVGPGTGVAPFRAYLQERQATGATGRNWLFFGEQRHTEDFLYREEFEAFQGDGILTRFDTAFSRDQAQKVYVQHRMQEHAAELWRWIDEGAHLYVCGDAARMAKDVDATLHAIVCEQGGKSSDEAAVYIEELKKIKRYKRDVY